MGRFIDRLSFGLSHPTTAVRNIRRKRRNRWTGGEGLSHRHYENYEQYLAHQKEKLDAHGHEWLADYDREYRERLRERLRASHAIPPGARVLCLAARLGTEVRSFVDLGCFAVGLDLNPGPQNRYVLHGDFHDIQFASGTVDVVFSNALDHAFDLERLAGEIRRVLQPAGVVVLEIVNGRKEGYTPGYYEASIWDSVEDVVQLFVAGGFSIMSRSPIEYPWAGQMVCLRRPPDPVRA